MAALQPPRMDGTALEAIFEAAWALTNLAVGAHARFLRVYYAIGLAWGEIFEADWALTKLAVGAHAPYMLFGSDIWPRRELGTSAKQGLAGVSKGLAGVSSLLRCVLCDGGPTPPCGLLPSLPCGCEPHTPCCLLLWRMQVGQHEVVKAVVPAAPVLIAYLGGGSGLAVAEQCAWALGASSAHFSPLNLY